ncbi:MAG: Smr/MutS family protein [Candidatus Binatia bacterium]
MTNDKNDNDSFDLFEDENPFPDPVALPLEDVLDLHPFLPEEIRSVVEEYLLQCCEAGFLVVRLIHGKGKGVQRESIRALLSRLPYVQEFRDAPIEAGSWGATIVHLAPDRATPLYDKPDK